MLHEPTLLRCLPFEIQPQTWDIVMCLRQLSDNFAVRSARYAYIPVYEVFCHFKVIRSAISSGGGDRRSADVTLISLSSPEGDEKQRLDDATECSPGWISPYFGGDRWPMLAAVETFMSPTSSGAAEPTATTSCRHDCLRRMRWCCEVSQDDRRRDGDSNVLVTLIVT